MAEKIKGLVVNIGGDTSAFTRSLKSADTAIRDTQKNLNAVNKLLKDPSNADNAELLAEKEKLLKTAIEQTKEKLEALQKVQDQVNEKHKSGEMPTEAYIKYQGELTKTQKSLDLLLQQEKATKEGSRKLEDQVKETSDNVENLGNSSITTGNLMRANLVSDVIMSGLRTIGAAAKEAMDFVNSIGMDFTQSMSDVAATMGMTADEINSGSASYEKLANAALKCGATTKYTAAESADALNYLALAGYDVNKAVETLPKILKLAQAGGMDIAYTSDMVTDSMSALQLETSELDKYMDMMAVTAQKSNTDVQMLGEAILQCGGTVKSTGQDLDVMMAALGSLANAGIKGQEGGTHLRNILLSLTSPTDTAKQKMEDLGLAVSDSAGNVRDINDIFTDLSSKLSTLDEISRSNVLSEIFNKTDLASVNAMMNAVDGSFDSLREKINNCDGAASNMAETMNNNLTGKTAEFRSQLESLGIAIFDHFDKPLQESVENGATLLDKLTKSVRSGDLADEFENMGDALGDFTDGAFELAEGALPVLVKGGTWLLDNGNAIIGTLSGIGTAMIISRGISVMQNGIKVVRDFADNVTAAKGALATLNAVSNATPWGLIATLAGVAVGGIVAYKSSVDNAKDSTAGLTDEQKELIKACDEANQKLEDQSKSREDSRKKIENEYGGYENLAAKIYELNEAESLNRGQKALMLSLVDELQQALPDLTLKIDDETGKLLTNKDAVYGAIKAKKEYYMVQAAQKNLSEIYEDVYSQEMKLAKLDSEISDNKKEQAKTQQEIIDFEKQMENLGANVGNKEIDIRAKLGRKLEEQQNAGEKLKNTYEDTEKSLADLNGEAKQASKYISDHADAVEKSADTMNSSVSASIDNIRNLYNESYEFNGKMYDITSDAKQKIKELDDDYNEQISKRTEELQKSLDIFEKFNGGAETTINTLTENLESNYDGITQWADNIQKLKDRGVTNGLIKQLEDMGPSAAEKVKALADATDTELDNYVNLWNDYNSKIPQIVNKEMESVKEEHDKGIQKILDEQQKEKSKMYLSAWNTAQSYFNGASDSGNENGALLKQLFKSVGAYIPAGMAEGIEENKHMVIEAVAGVNAAMIGLTTTQFGIHSPSKLEADFGKFIMLGRAKGISDNANEVYNKISEVNNKMMELNNNLLRKMETANSSARALYNGDFEKYAVHDTVLQSTSKKSSDSDIQSVKMPDTLHVTMVTPSGKVFAEESFPFLDTMINNANNRKSRGSVRR